MGSCECPSKSSNLGVVLGKPTQEPLRPVSGIVNLIFLRILQKREVPWVWDEEYL